jgi:hypothetical protein
MEERVVTQLYSFQGNAKNNIIISADDGGLSFEINKDRIFETLFWRKEICATLSKKLDEVLTKHLDKMAREEEELRQGK